MKVEVINREADVGRWRAIAVRLRQAGLEPVREAAIVGSEMTAAEIGALYSPRLNRSGYAKPLCAGEIGCYASHLAVWRRLLESDRPAVVVFEDDVEIAADLPAVLQSLMRDTGRWDLVKLIGRSHEDAAGRRPLFAGRELIGYKRVPSLTSAYVVSRRGAQKLLAARQPFGRPIDVDIRHWWECDLRVVGVYPYPVRRAATSTPSTIEPRRSRRDLATRLRKLWLQARYTLLNRIARSRRAIADAHRPPAEAQGVRAVWRDAV